MYGAVFRTSRSCGVLNAPFNRPESAAPVSVSSSDSSGVKVLWRPLSVSSGPPWQAAQAPLPTNSSSPRRAAGESVPRSKSVRGGLERLEVRRDRGGLARGRLRRLALAVGEVRADRAGDEGLEARLPTVPSVRGRVADAPQRQRIAGPAEVAAPLRVHDRPHVGVGPAAADVARLAGLPALDALGGVEEPPALCDERGPGDVGALGVDGPQDAVALVPRQPADVAVWIGRRLGRRARQREHDHRRRPDGGDEEDDTQDGVARPHRGRASRGSIAQASAGAEASRLRKSGLGA